MTSYRNPAAVLPQRAATNLASALLLAAAATGVPAPVHAQDADKLTIDQLLSIESVVSGSPAWSPDGSSILFQSSLSGGLVTLGPDGGFPTRVPIELGSSGHFLASQMPGWSPQGNWISYVSDKGGSPEVWVWSTRDGHRDAAHQPGRAHQLDDLVARRALDRLRRRPLRQLRHLDGRGRHPARPAHHERQAVRGLPDLDARLATHPLRAPRRRLGGSRRGRGRSGRIERAHRAPGSRLLRLRRRRHLRLPAGLARRHPGPLPLAPQRLDQLLARPDRGR